MKNALDRRATPLVFVLMLLAACGGGGGGGGSSVPLATAPGALTIGTASPFDKSLSVSLFCPGRQDLAVAELGSLHAELPPGEKILLLRPPVGWGDYHNGLDKDCG